MSDKEVKIRITGDVSDIEKKLKSIENSLNNLGKGNSGNNKFVNSLIDDISKAEKEANELGVTLDNMSDSTRKFGKDNAFAEMAADAEDMGDKVNKAVSRVTDLSKKFNDINNKSLKEANKEMTDLTEQTEKMKKTTEEAFDDFDGKKKVANLDFGGTQKSINEMKKQGGGILSDMAPTIVSSAVASKMMSSAIGDVTEGLKDAIAALNALGDNSSISEKVAAFDNFADYLKKTRQYVKDLEEEIAGLENKRGDIRSNKDGIVGNIDDIKEEIEQMERLKKALNELNDDDVVFHYDDLLGGSEYSLKEINEQIDATKEYIESYKEMLKLQESNKSGRLPYDPFEFTMDLDQAERELKDFLELRRRAIKEIEQDHNVDLNDMTDWNDEDAEYLDELRQSLNRYNSELKETRSAEADAADITEQLAVKRRELAEAQRELNIAEVKEQSYANEFFDQYEAYKKLKDAINDVIDDENESILVKKRLAQALDDVSQSMHRMYKDVDKHPMTGTLESLGTEVDELRKNFNLFSADNLFDDLDRLGKNIEDKIEKTKEFRESSRKMFGSDNNAYKLEADAKAIKEYADAVGYALEKVEGAEDEFNIVGNKQAQKALEGSLDVRRIDEYTDAIKEYLQLINDTNGQISKRFLDDNGMFDISKYIADYERFGKPINQLMANFKALRQQVLEFLKVQDEVDDLKADTTILKMYKEEAEAAQKAAKTRLESAQTAVKEAEAEKKAAQSKEESAKASEKLTKANTELNEAKEKMAKADEDVLEYTEKLKNAQKDLAEAQERAAKAEKESTADRAEAVKQINEYAQALRKLGQAADDIELDEIRDIDKTLGTKLKDLFSNGLPKTFGEIGEYIKSAFSELNDLDFGNFGSLLKDAGSGFLKNIFAKLPAEAKIAAAAIAAVTVALNKLYESGKQQFFGGLSNAVNKLQPVINAFQSFGREAVTAFESITGTNVDLSSLMELGPNFEYQMKKVGTIAGSNTRQLEELTRAAEHLGGTTQFSATQVGEAFEYMAKHTWSVIEKSIAKNTGLNIGKLSYYVLLIYILYLFNIV